MDGRRVKVALNADPMALQKLSGSPSFRIAQLANTRTATIDASMPPSVTGGA
jgi:hypothetical protein